MARFKIGQRVVALINHSSGLFKKGDVVIVDGYTECPKCRMEAIFIHGICDEAIQTHYYNNGCGYRSNYLVRRSFASSNFAPIEPQREKITYKFKVNIPKPEVIEREQLIELKELESQWKK